MMPPEQDGGVNIHRVLVHFWTVGRSGDTAAIFV